MTVTVMDGPPRNTYLAGVAAGAARDYMAEVAEGNIPGRSIMSAIGARPIMGTTATGEDLWPGTATTIPLPASAGEQLSVVSTDVQDTATAGTGARRLRVHYLDSAGDAQVTTVDLDGTTPVDLLPTHVRYVNDVYAVLSGTNGVAEGNITVYRKTDATRIYNMIALGGNKSLVPNRMVPLGHTLILAGWHAAEAKNKLCDIKLRSTDMYGDLWPAAFCFKDVVSLQKQASGWLPRRVKIPALSVIKVSAWPTEDEGSASCSWEGVLIEDGS
ncbi:MAG: hypothetical protein GY767_22335 [Shimia sp.]|nr:hypothetical protein [Shimia sp.]